MKSQKKPPSIAQVRYNPPQPYRLDLEVFSIADRGKQVANPSSFKNTHRIDFHLLICVTKGQIVHTVDFEPIQCGPGSILTLRPTQTQGFDLSTDWDAWFVMFRPEFLLPLQTSVPVDDIKALGNLETLPVHIALEQSEHLAICDAIMQMHKDAKMNAPSTRLHALLRHQLYALLLRLTLLNGQQEDRGEIPAASLQRFKRFQHMVEKNFAHQHQVADYAAQLGISEKSLTRAIQDVVGTTAKAYIAARINLEAKRLLAHTALPIAAIADQVGFDESTNFVKFFKREVGCSPGEFRRQHAQ